MAAWQPIFNQHPRDTYNEFRRLAVHLAALVVSPLTTKGDLWTYGTADARLAVGADGKVLTADSSTATGLKWVAPLGSGAEVHANSNKNASHNAWTSASYQVVDFDPDSYWSSGADTRLTVPTGLGGRYVISFSATLERNVTGQRSIRIVKNGSVNLTTNTTDAVSEVSIWTHRAVSTVAFLAAGDYVEGQLYNNSGGTLVIDSGTGAGTADQQARLSVTLVGKA